MEGGTIPAHITLYLMLGICVVLLTVNFIEIFKITKIWGNHFQFEPFFFEMCVKNDLIVKTVFTSFSLLAAFSATAFICQMLIFMQVFLNKFLNSFLYLNYLVFGLYMLAFCIFGLFKWSDVAYTCDKKIPSIKIFSVGNIFSLIGCTVLSILIVFGTSIYSTMTLYTDSLLRREEGSAVLRNVFWWFVLRGRNHENLGNLGNNLDIPVIQPPDNIEIQQLNNNNENEEAPLLNNNGSQNNPNN